VRIDGELMEIWPNEVCDMVVYFGVMEVVKTEVLGRQVEGVGVDKDQMILIYRLRNYTVTTQYL